MAHNLNDNYMHEIMRYESEISFISSTHNTWMCFHNIYIFLMGDIDTVANNTGYVPNKIIFLMLQILFPVLVDPI